MVSGDGRHLDEIGALVGPDRWRGLLAVIASAGMVGITIGYMAPLVAIILENQGHPNWAIGLNGAAPALATILLGPLVPKLFSKIGFYPSMMLAVFGEAVCILLLLVYQDIWVWAVLRFAIGFFGTVHWIGSETWIVSMAPPAQRGRAIALYMIAISGGFAAGPVVIKATGTEGVLPFLVGAGLILAAAPCIWAARGIVPKLPHAPKAALVQSFRLAPLVMAAALLAGFVDMSAITHLVNYGTAAGLSPDTALLMLTIMLTANVVMQFPVGWLADRVNKRNLLICFGVIFFLAPILVTMTAGKSFLLWPVLMVWGVASLGIYTVALTILGERFEAKLLASANAGIVAVYQLGGVSGPMASGSGMDLIYPNGLMYVFAVAGFLFLCFAGYRTWVRRKQGMAEDARPLPVANEDRG
ncbi:MAG: MFS transporter [Pseudomonadota bacterium]